MFLIIVSFHLIFSISFSSQVDFGLGWDRSSEFEKDDSKLESSQFFTQTRKLPKTINKSDLEELLNLKQQYMLKNHIDDFETHFGLRFTPNWTKVDSCKSPIRQSVEIRRQKWNYLMINFNESHPIVRLNFELEKAGVNRTTFCKHIAEVYFVLSNNAYIFDKEPNSDKKRKHFQYVRNPLHEKIIRAFMNSVSQSKLMWSENEEIVQLPKSLYIDLMRKDVHSAVIKLHYKHQMKRLKDACRKRMDEDDHVNR